MTYTSIPTHDGIGYALSNPHKITSRNDLYFEKIMGNAGGRVLSLGYMPDPGAFHAMTGINTQPLADCSSRSGVRGSWWGGLCTSTCLPHGFPYTMSDDGVAKTPHAAPPIGRAPTHMVVLTLLSTHHTGPAGALLLLLHNRAFSR